MHEAAQWSMTNFQVMMTRIAVHVWWWKLMCLDVRSSFTASPWEQCSHAAINDAISGLVRGQVAYAMASCSNGKTKATGEMRADGEVCVAIWWRACCHMCMVVVGRSAAQHEEQSTQYITS